VSRALLAAGLALALVASAAASCGSPTYYRWGRYEDSVYAVTRQPDGFDLQAEIDTLEQDLAQTMDAQRPVPPGLHAHLGYLHSVAGNPTAAREHFLDEKSLFPESAVFMDHLLLRLGMQP
jgi:hypothetical protein